MTAVIKAIGILLLQIIIYYLFGTIFELFCRKKHGVVFKEISGFLVYQVLFQICALPMIKADQTLARLAVLWGVIVITCCIGTAIFCRERIAEDIAMIIKAFFRHKIWFLLMGCFLFDNTIYTSAAFLLHRAYEGKAYAGNMLLLFTIYLCILYIRQRDKWSCIYLILTLWACIAISSSAIMVTGAACGVLLIPVVFEKLIRRIKRDKNYD